MIEEKCFKAFNNTRNEHRSFTSIWNQNILSWNIGNVHWLMDWSESECQKYISLPGLCFGKSGFCFCFLKTPSSHTQLLPTFKATGRQVFGIKSYLKTNWEIVKKLSFIYKIWQTQYQNKAILHLYYLDITIISITGQTCQQTYNGAGGFFVSLRSDFILRNCVKA